MLTVHQDGSFSYDPNGNFAAGGTDSFTYTVSDGHGGEATATATITVTASTGNLSVSVSLGSGVTLPVLNCTQVTLGDFHAVLVSSGGAVTTLPLSPIAGSSTFGASFQNIPPGSYKITLVAPTGMSFFTAPALPVAITISAGQQAQQAFTITAASAP